MKFKLAVIVIILITLVRVAATHRVFSETSDENAHVAGGHEWLTSNTYRIDPTHPPLARIFFALPFRDIPPAKSRYENFPHILFGHNNEYVRNVAHARRGNLLFLALLLVVATLWTRKLFGECAALIALIIVASMPPVLAHAGLATTDLPVAATMLFALYALDLFLDEPSWRRTILLGVAAGCGLTSKFSFIPFFAIAALVMVVARRFIPSVSEGPGRLDGAPPNRPAPSLTLGMMMMAAIAISLLFVWGIYKFAWGPMEDEYHGMTKATAELLHSERIALVPIPAPAFFCGILAVKKHDQRGHTSYLFGHLSDQGFWNYFPVALSVKTPIPVLILFLLGAISLFRARQRIDLVMIVLAILAYAMTSHINIGVRHILPLYPLIAIVAASGVTRVILSEAKDPEVSAPGPTPSARLRMTLAMALLAWLVLGAALAHPDYLPWFNGFAGREPYRVLVDSNFDWGQDLLRLARACRDQHIDHLGIALFTPAALHDVGLPSTHELGWYKPESGWAAISETSLQLARAREPLAFMWLTEGRDYVRIGKTIRLYRVQP